MLTYRFGFLQSLHVTVVAFAAILVCSGSSAQTNHASNVEHRVQSAFKKIRPAIVKLQFPNGSGRQITNTGVVISKQGHIVSSGHDRRAEDREKNVKVVFPDGRTTNASFLGWSDEWRIELLRITDRGPWHHVDIDTSSKVQTGQHCFVSGYPKHNSHSDGKPSVQLGTITQSAFPFWVISSVDKNNSSGGLFDLQGRLLAITTRTHRCSAHTCIHLLMEHWEDFAAGKNLDRVRLEETKCKASEVVISSKPRSDSEIDQAVKLAKSTTVRIATEDKKAGSGVIVSADGHVLTQAHGPTKIPGKKVTVSLADGRNLDGKVLGSNIISDIAVIKITDRGNWPYVEFGNSTMMQSGTECIFTGYPHEHEGLEPLAKKPVLTTLKNRTWSNLLWTKDYDLRGGDSGGGLFDSRGRLIGIALGYTARPRFAFHARVELYCKQWDLLTDETLVKQNMSEIQK